MAKKLITFHVTPAEKRLIKSLSSGNVSAYLRALVLDDARRRGEPVPADRLEDTRGKYHRQSKERK